jgi:trigger factor
MKTSVTDSGLLRKTIIISYTADEVRTRRAQVLRQLASEVRMDGFRPGKTSIAMLEKRYGAGATAATEERLGDEAFNAALKEHNLRPIGPVASDAVNRDNGALSFTVSVDVKPTVTIPSAKEFVLEDAPVDIPEQEVTEALTGLAKRAGTMSPLADGETVIEDDSITVSGNVSVGGTEVRKLHDFNHLVGGYPFFGKPPAEVVELLQGKKAGDALTFTATLPQSFTPAENAGKEATIAVTIVAANRLRAAPLDDEFAKKMGAESIEALKTMFKARLIGNKEGQKRASQIESLTTQLLEKVQIDLPEKLLAQTIADAEAEAVRRAEAQKQDADKAKADAAAEATKGLRRFIILDALASSLEVTVDNDDLNDQIRMAAYHTGRKPEEVAKQLKESGRINQVVMEIREAKSLETLLDKVLAKEAAAAG